MAKVSLEIRDPWKAQLQVCQASATDNLTQIRLLRGELYEHQERIEKQIREAEERLRLAKESGGVILNLLRKEAGIEEGIYTLTPDGSTMIGEAKEKT